MLHMRLMGLEQSCQFRFGDYFDLSIKTEYFGIYLLPFQDERKYILLVLLYSLFWAEN